MRALETPEAAHAWELRKHWALGTEVICVLDPDVAEIPRVRGLVLWVAPTGAAARLDDGVKTRSLEGSEDRDVGILVPVVAIRALRRPNYMEDGSRERRRGPLRRPEPPPGQFSLFEDEDGQMTLEAA